MSEFEKLKATLNDKWLDYYEVNRSWLKKELPSNNNGYMDSSILAYIILISIKNSKKGQKKEQKIHN